MNCHICFGVSSDWCLDFTSSSPTDAHLLSLSLLLIDSLTNCPIDSSVHVLCLSIDRLSGWLSDCHTNDWFFGYLMELFQIFRLGMHFSSGVRATAKFELERMWKEGSMITVTKILSRDSQPGSLRARVLNIISLSCLVWLMDCLAAWLAGWLTFECIGFRLDGCVSHWGGGGCIRDLVTRPVLASWLWSETAAK